MRFGLVVFVFAWLTAPGQALEESQVQECICKQGRMEVATPAGTYVDCLLDDYAVEVDPSDRWAEALGQALHYALETKRSAKVVLYCESEQDNDALCYRHALRLEQTIKGHGLPVVVELHNAQSLSEICSFED